MPYNKGAHATENRGVVQGGRMRSENAEVVCLLGLLRKNTERPKRFGHSSGCHLQPGASRLRAVAEKLLIQPAMVVGSGVPIFPRVDGGATRRRHEMKWKILMADAMEAGLGRPNQQLVDEL